MGAEAWLTVGMSVVVLFAGCIGGSENVAQQSLPSTKEIRWETKTLAESFTGTLTGSSLFGISPAPVSESYPLEVPPNAKSVSAVLAWSGPASALELVLVDPAQGRESAFCMDTLDGCEATIEISEEVAQGTWTLEVVAHLAVETAFELATTVVYAEAVEVEVPATPGVMAQTAGPFERTDSPVTVEQDGDDYVARQKVTLTNAIGQVSLVRTSVSTYNGPLAYTGGSESAYTIEAGLYARGKTEEEARTLIAQIRITHAERLDGSTLVLETNAAGPESTGVAVGATLPSAKTCHLEGKTSNGPVAVENLACDVLRVSTSNGPVAIQDAKARILDVRSTNGPVAVERFAPTASGEFTIATTNGPVAVELPENAQIGYDLVARTTNGPIVIGLSDGTTTEEGPEQKRFATNGYDSRSVRVKASIATTNGPVAVEAA